MADNNKQNADNQERCENYTAVGENLAREQGLAPPTEEPAAQGKPVQEDPKDDAIYNHRPPASDAVGEYATFSAPGDTSDSAAPAFLSTDSETEEPQKTVAPEPTPVIPAADAPPSKSQGDLWQTILRPVVALFIICLITSLLLSLTNGLTDPIIKANAAAVAEQARVDLLPEADGFEEVKVPEELKTITSIYRATNDTGWIIGAYGRGYGGQVPVLVGFDQEGTIIGVTFTENSETVGLGQKVREPSFYEQFAGRPAESLTLGDIDKIASATISTNAAISAVNDAISAYHTLSGSGSASGNPPTISAAQAPDYLLPGQTMTPITIDAPGVQPTAYRGENGDYIIFGEADGDRIETGSIVVAGVAMNSDGKIIKLWLDTSGEMYGLPLASDSAFINDFIGQTAPVTVDAVASVTGTTNSIKKAVDNALFALPQAKEAA